MAMALPYARPQKRKNDDDTDYTRASKKPKSSIPLPTYQYPAQSSSYYQAIPTGLPPHMQQQTSRRQPPNPQFPYLYNVTPTNTAYKDAIVANTWLQEWQTVPTGFEPSRPLSLLIEPASINMTTHVRKTNKVHLNHWDRDHEPHGTTIQRLEREVKRLERRKQDLVFEGTKQDAKRSQVKEAAQNAEVIDLTEDDGVANEASWRHAGVKDAQDYPLRYQGQDKKTLDALSCQDKLLAQISLDPTAYNFGCTIPYPQTAFGTSHH
jgi:hypothetical protein